MNGAESPAAYAAGQNANGAVRSPMCGLTIICVSYNSAAVLPAFFASARSMGAVQMILVDNGSSDESVQLARRCPGVEVIELGHNHGYGAAVNAGARCAHGALLLVLNPDALVIRIDHDELKELEGQEGPLGLVACRIVDKSGRPRFLVRRDVSWPVELFHQVVVTFLKPKEWHDDRLRTPRGRQKLWVSGAAFLVRRDEFLSVGGFDERIFMYGEDVQLARTYRRQNLPIRRTLGVTVAHHGAQSSDASAVARACWNALSLVERTSTTFGTRRSAMAAGAYVGALWAVTVAGHMGSHVPCLRARARKQAARAASVRLGLARIATCKDEVYPWYPVARRAFAGRSVRRVRV